MQARSKVITLTASTGSCIPTYRRCALARQTSPICVMSGAPGRVTRVAALEEVRAALRPIRSVTQEPSHARRFAHEANGGRVAASWRTETPTYPRFASMQNGAALRLGSEQRESQRQHVQPLLRNGKPTDTNRQRPKRLTCGASLKPVLHRMACDVNEMDERALLANSRLKTKTCRGEDCEYRSASGESRLPVVVASGRNVIRQRWASRTRVTRTSRSFGTR